MPTSALNGVPAPRRRSNPTRRPNAPSSSLLGSDAVAEWLGVEVVFVRRLVAERRIPFVKVGRLVRFDPEDIAAWIDGQQVAWEGPTLRRVNWTSPASLRENGRAGAATYREQQR